MTATSWSGHCRNMPQVHFFGTEAEVDAWLARKRSDSVVRKLNALLGNAEHYDWVKSRPGQFKYTDHGTRDAEDRVSGEAAYVGDRATALPYGTYADPPLCVATGDPASWLGVVTNARKGG